MLELDLDDLREVYGHYLPGRRFPKTIAPGVQWLGGCSAIALDEGRPDIRHSQCNCYLVTGDTGTLLVDSGHPAFWGGYRDALYQALDGRPLDYVMPTHAEVPHAGALTLLYHEWPGLTVVGNTQDYHLFHPELPDSAYRPMPVVGNQLVDLGGRTFEIMPALFKDLATTVWGFDDRTKVFFPADAFAYMHWHSEDACGLTMEELPGEPEPDNFQFIISGVQYRDMNEKVDRFQELMTEYQVVTLAPAHGTVLTDMARTRWFLDGLREMTPDKAGH
ncbi:MAG TPA: MBL fold metallo-hydrolase [Pseudonocardiaceae bacterium]|jgi:flavorubredoxin|nr:MBL fold metallo-hydrolase [Pseudonocardiaceae bacterium]